MSDDLTTTHTLARRRKYTIHVPRLGPVTYSRGESVPPKHFTHVPPTDRRWFDAPDDSRDETEGDTPESGDA